MKFLFSIFFLVFLLNGLSAQQDLTARLFPENYLVSQFYQGADDFSVVVCEAYDEGKVIYRMQGLEILDSIIIDQDLLSSQGDEIVAIHNFTEETFYGVTRRGSLIVSDFNDGSVMVSELVIPGGDTTVSIRNGLSYGDHIILFGSYWYPHNSGSSSVPRLIKYNTVSGETEILAKGFGLTNKVSRLNENRFLILSDFYVSDSKLYVTDGNFDIIQEIEIEGKCYDFDVNGNQVILAGSLNQESRIHRIDLETEAISTIFENPAGYSVERLKKFDQSNELLFVERKLNAPFPGAYMVVGRIDLNEPETIPEYFQLPDYDFYYSTYSVGILENQQGVFIAGATQVDDIIGFGRGYVLQLNDDLVSTKEQIRQTIAVFPNPVTSILVIGENTLVKQISIFDQNGKQVFSCRNSNRVDLSGLTAGIYYLEYLTDAGSERKKIVKQ